MARTPAHTVNIELDIVGHNDDLLGYSFILDLENRERRILFSSGDSATGNNAAPPHPDGWLRGDGIDVSDIVWVVVWAFRSDRAKISGSVQIGPKSVKNQYYLVTGLGKDVTVTQTQQNTNTRQGGSLDWNANATGKLTFGPKWLIGGAEVGAGGGVTHKGAVNTTQNQGTSTISFPTKLLTRLQVDFRAGAPQYSMAAPSSAATAG